jgi:hypothetical protein
MNVKLFVEKDEYLLFVRIHDINNDRAREPTMTITITMTCIGQRQ